jgi:sugar/nucleoside kinase (ribokinase family)
MDVVRLGRHLHLGSYFLLDNLRPAVPDLFQTARKWGLTVSLDTNYDPREQWDGGLHEALQHTDVFLPNETELLTIAGADSLDQAAAKMRHVPTIAVKLGAKGACAWHTADDNHKVCVGTGSVTVVDTTGAGDSFDAGFVYGHLAGWDLTRTLRFASTCGSLSTRAIGGTGSQATLDEALRAELECPLMSG